MFEKDNKFLISHALDKCRECDSKNTVSCTGFLDLHQQSVVMKERYPIPPVFYGGYEDAERQMLMFLPEYVDCPENTDEIMLIEVSARLQLTHRDYLGSLMALGIKRENIGDIIINKKKAYIFIKPSIENFLLSNFTKAGKSELVCKTVPMSDFKKTEYTAVSVTKTSASPRLDSVIGSLFNMSRTQSQQFISSGKVFINNMEALKTDKLVKSGDRLTLRTKGKAHIIEIGELTKKGRIKIIAEIFA